MHASLHDRGPTAGRMRRLAAPMTDERRPASPPTRPIPSEVGRVLLLYSGGLDTSVMLHWIQERYGAEIVTLTVDLGQPGEDWDVVVGKARDLGAVDAIVVDAREEFARDYVLPAIKANALYGGGYPLFTALGRPLIAKLAVEHARASRLRHDRPRLHRQGQRPGADRRHDRDARSRSSGCSRRCASGGWAARRRSPTRASTGSRSRAANEAAAPYSIDDNLWGRSSEGRVDRGPRRAAARRRLPARHPARGRARRARAGPDRLRGRPARCRSTASASGWSS